MKINISKKEILLILAIVVAIIFFLPYIFIQPSIFPTFEGKGDIGATLNGITAPFLSAFGSVLVYLALKSQIDANEEFKRQFQKQNNDQLFFRLMDNIKNVVHQYQINQNQKELKGYDALRSLVGIFNQVIKAETPKYLIDYIHFYPNEVLEEHYNQIVHAMNNNMPLGELEEKVELFKTELLNRKNEERTDSLKSFYYFTKQNGRNLALELGAFYLFTSEMEKKQLWYKDFFERVYNKHSVFYDSYLGNFKYAIELVNSIDSPNEKKFYVNYLKANLTNNEKALIYFYLFSGRKEKTLKDFLKEHHILDDLEYDHYTTAPTAEFYKKDLQQLLS